MEKALRACQQPFLFFKIGTKDGNEAPKFDIGQVITLLGIDMGIDIGKF